MTRARSVLELAFGIALCTIALVASVAAWAGNQVALEGPAGPVLLDLSTLGLPGALVIIAWMYRDTIRRGLKLTVHHVPHRPRDYPDDATGPL